MTVAPCSAEQLTASGSNTTLPPRYRDSHDW